MKAIFSYSGTIDQLDGVAGYTKHNGPVEVLTSLHPSKYDLEEVGLMYRVRAADGWEGDAFLDELQHVA